MICIHCGEVGLPGLQDTTNHNCLRHGFHPGSAMKFLQECTLCHLGFRSVFRLMFHVIMCHGRVGGNFCPVIKCGRCYYNKACFDLHIDRYHAGSNNMYAQLAKEYGPTPPLSSFLYIDIKYLLSFFLMIDE